MGSRACSPVFFHDSTHVSRHASCVWVSQCQIVTRSTSRFHIFHGHVSTTSSNCVDRSTLKLRVRSKRRSSWCLATFPVTRSFIHVTHECWCTMHACGVFRTVGSKGWGIKPQWPPFQFTWLTMQLNRGQLNLSHAQRQSHMMLLSIL